MRESSDFQNPYLSIRHAAQMLSVTPLTLRNWDKRGVLVAYRNPANNYRVYKRDQVEMFLRRIENTRNRKGARKIDITVLE